jgi:hypothetical protein
MDRESLFELQLKNMKYFYLSWTEDDLLGLEPAKAPKGTLGYELEKELRGKHELPFTLSLDDDALLLDYLPNTLAWPLMSERLKNLISDILTGNEGLDWVSAKVSHKGQILPYYVPRFLKQLDILDRSKTISAGKENEAIVKAHLSLSKVKNLTFFPLPDWRINCSNIVSEFLKKKIEKAGLTGMRFSKVSASWFSF